MLDDRGSTLTILMLTDVKDKRHNILIKYNAQKYCCSIDMLISGVTGMHRKSLEAADQLKDDNTCSNNTSDKEEEGDHDHHRESTSSNKSDNSGCSSASGSGDKMVSSQQEQEMRLQQDLHNHHAAVMQLAANTRTDPEQFRNNSIACLRAKAQEHNAKILSLSADALMLVNNNAVSLLRNRSINNNVDANANNLHHHHHAPPEIATSSDTSSSMF